MNTILKLFIAAASGFFVAAWLYAYKTPIDELTETRITRPVPDKQNHISSNESIKPVTADHTEKLLQENSALKREIVELQRQLETLATPGNSTHAEAEQMANNPDPAYQDIETYSKIMQTEERDADWVRSMEPAIEQLLTSEEMEGISMIASECRTTLCRLDFMLENIAQSDRAESYLLSTLADQTNGSLKIRKIAYPEGGMKMVVFYSRQGYFLEEPN